MHSLGDSLVQKYTNVMQQCTNDPHWELLTKKELKHCFHSSTLHNSLNAVIQLHNQWQPIMSVHFHTLDEIHYLKFVLLLVLAYMVFCWIKTTKFWFTFICFFLFLVNTNQYISFTWMCSLTYFDEHISHATAPWHNSQFFLFIF